MKALLADGKGGAAVGEFDDLTVRESYIKIKVRAIALNPTDYKHVFHFTKGGEIVGIDVAGTVEAIGSNITSKVAIGDRIAGMVHGCNTYSFRDGGFAEYAELKDGIFAHIPNEWSWEQGATLGAGITTAGQGLFQSLNLPTPDQPTNQNIAVLIYGGSTATGCLAIQFAKHAGLEVITLASPREFERLKRLGAAYCYDYHTPGIGKTINQDFSDKLMFAFDIITSTDSMGICADALASQSIDGQKPKITLLLPGRIFPRTDIDVYETSGYSVIGEKSIKYGKIVEGNLADYEWGRRHWAMANRLLQEGKLYNHELEVRPGGLDAVISGLKDLERGHVKGKKLVYPL